MQWLIHVNNYFDTGDNESGKTSIMARLQGIEDPRRGYGLEYQYIDVKDEYRDGMINGYFLHLHIVN